MGIGNTLDIGKIGNTRWDDLSVPATTVMVGANAKPDFDYVNIGRLFPQNDATEKVYATFQMSHKKKLGTSIRLHIHFIQTSALVPVFRAETRFYNNGSLETSFANSDTTGTLLFPYVSGRLLQVLSFPVIEPPESEGLSANLDMILYRTDNVVTGDVLVKYFDIHYQIDSDGSQEERVK